MNVPYQIFSWSQNAERHSSEIIKTKMGVQKKLVLEYLWEDEKFAQSSVMWQHLHVFQACKSKGFYKLKFFMVKNLLS